MQRRNRALHGLAPHSLVRDLLRVALIGAVLAGFVQTLNSYDGISVPVMLLLVLLGVFSYVTSQTVFGRRIYSVGSNMEATRLSGINVQAVKRHHLRKAVYESISACRVERNGTHQPAVCFRTA